MLREEGVAHAGVHEADLHEPLKEVVVGHDAGLRIEQNRSARVDEEREGVPTLVDLAVRGVHDAVPGGLHAATADRPLGVELTAEEQLEHVPGVDDDLARLFVRIEPGTIVGPHLEPARGGGEQERDEVDVRVLPGSHGARRTRAVDRRVVEHAQQRVATADHARERVRGKSEVLVQAAEQIEGEALECAVERDHHRTELRNQIIREEVLPGLTGSAHVPEPLEVRLVLRRVAGVLDLEGCEAGRAAVDRRFPALEHVVAVGEEIPGHPTARVDEVCRHARVGELREPDVVEGATELAYEALPVSSQKPRIDGGNFGHVPLPF